MPELRTPPPLEPGDQVAVVAPSSGRAAAYPHVYDLGLRRLRSSFDLEPVEFPTATRENDYLRAHPEDRARDVEDAFRDPEIAGVVATIGGSDQYRILPHLDPAVLREHPTRFFGYSDSTHLALYLFDLGVVSFQGPMVMTELAMQGEMHPYTVEHARRAFFEDDVGAVEPAPEFTDQDLPWGDESNLRRRREFEPNPGRRWHGGDGPVSGPLWGGCLEILAVQLVADRWLPDPASLDGAVLFVETSEELRPATWVGDVLAGMGERGLLERFAGVVVGRAKARSHRDERPPDERERHRSAQREAIRTAMDRYTPDAPVVFDVDCGHTNPIVPLPVGGTVHLDPADDELRVELP